MPAEILYLDSSALLKLVFREAESPAVKALLDPWPAQASSVIASVEVLRACRRLGPGSLRRGATVLARVGLIELDDAILVAASEVGPPELRSLDAIHLATVLSLGDELGAMCVYDRRLAAAASAAGINVLSPT